MVIHNKTLSICTLFLKPYQICAYPPINQHIRYSQNRSINTPRPVSLPFWKVLFSSIFGSRHIIRITHQRKLTLDWKVEKQFHCFIFYILFTHQHLSLCCSSLVLFEKSCGCTSRLCSVLWNLKRSQQRNLVVGPAVKMLQMTVKKQKGAETRARQFQTFGKSMRKSLLLMMVVNMTYVSEFLSFSCSIMASWI